METRAPLIASLLIVAGMAALSLRASPTISDSARIATHFDWAGTPNGYMDKTHALWFAPLSGLGIAALFLVLPLLTRRKEGLARSGGAYVAGWIGTLLLLAVAHCVIVLRARGIVLDVTGNLTFAAALFFVVAGNLLGKTAPNDFVGVRTPWTKRSDYAWEKANRLAGYLTVATGLVTLGALALGDARHARLVMLAGLLAMAVISVIASYFYWRSDPDRVGRN